MKKLIISSIIVLFILITACGHYAYVYNFLACVFYGECSEYYIDESTQSVQFTAIGQNDGTTLSGEWQNKDSQNNYILNFNNDGKLNVALYQEGELERYDLGQYTVKNDILTINMDNGTLSVVKYQISNSMLTLTSIKSQDEVNSSDM